MVNVIKDIVNKLDGTSCDNQGFAVVTALTEKYEGSLIKLQVKPYLKYEGTKGIPEEEHLKEMIDRLGYHYSDGPHYAVYKAEKLVGLWELTVQEVQEKTEDKANEVQDIL